MQHSIRQYRAAFFQELRARLEESGVDLQLIHSDHPDYLGASPEKARLPWVEVRPARRLWVRGRSLLWQPVLRQTRGASLVIVEQANYLLANYLLVAGQSLAGPPTAFWGHGRNFQRPADDHSGAARAKRVLSRHVHWWFAYNDVAAAAVADMGFPRERITVVQNSSDTRALAAEVEAVTPGDVAKVRRELDLVGTNVALFLGTLGAVKRFDYLFAAADLIRARVPDFELVIVGNGMEQSLLESLCSQRPWARYAGPRFGVELSPLLAQAKLLLVPAWAGLVVVDSFGAGVPLVASQALPHPPEIAYLQDGVNGLVVDDGGDPATYAGAVAELLEDEGRRQTLVAGCRAARMTYNVENMADHFTQGVVRALAAKRESREGRRSRSA